MQNLTKKTSKLLRWENFVKIDSILKAVFTALITRRKATVSYW